MANDLHHHSLRWWVRAGTLLIAFLTIAACATTHPADTVVTYDWDADELLIEPLPSGDPVVRMRIEAPAVVDLNSNSGTLCGMSSDRQVWLASLHEGRAHFLADLSLDNVERLVSADSDGRCVYARGPSSVAIATADNPEVVMELDDDGQFEWEDIAYSDHSGATALVGRNSFAILGPGEARDPQVVTPHGRYRGNRFLYFQCCAALSPDGRILYSGAAVAADDTSVDAIVAVDVSTGLLQRVYLPWAPDGTDLVEVRHNPPTGSIVLASSLRGYPLFLSPDGATLFVSALATDASGDVEFMLAAIDMRDGQVRRISEEHDIKGITASGERFIVRADQTKVAMPVRTPDGRVVVPLPSPILTVGHGEGGGDWIPVVEVPYRLSSESAGSSVAGALLALMRSTATLSEFRQVAMPDSKSIVDLLRVRLEGPEHSRATVFGHDMQVADHDRAAWRRLKDHCRQWAQGFVRSSRATNEQLCLLSALVHDQ